MPVSKHGTPALMPRWEPVRGSDTTLVVQLEQELASRIADHTLRAGSRLPSVRRMAESAGVSRFTVLEAYDRLVSKGLIEPRPGAGYFVRPIASAAPLADMAAPPTALPPQLDVAWLLRGMFPESAAVEISAAAGLLPADWMNPDMVNAAIRAAGRSAPAACLGYGHPQGYTPLREQLATQLHSQGIAANRDQNLMLTAGVTHALDLLFRLLLQPGDTVMVEDPGWFLIFGRLAACGVRIVGVPRGPDGPDLGIMEQLAVTHKPKLFLINSAVHNPTGHTLSAAAAHDVLRLAEKHDFLIIEDDTYADFHPGVPVRLASLDRLRRVVLVGGYAKTLAAGLRVGFLAASPELILRLTDLKLLAGLTTSSLGESVVHRLLQEGQYRRQVARLRQRVDQARQRCLERMTACGLTVPHLPSAGIFVWADCGRNSEVLARQAAERGVLLAPGVLFSPVQAPSSCIRLTVSMADHPKFWSVLQKLLSA
ncbi:aminotransferase-like domain-containing protein [Acetobacter orleanensis]|uniref:GntR family transcriptional regulator n=1 Tax=Acetobacter orleanensis TaxID=104099 RepID=A0A4Y3TNL7_9PROT|nr:PLP-dependent aminotransferase family protein [Acetobacter orleanensis]KXV63005.1 GntR family transcriptional regulator [Acetobacter orleanensis]PCD78847.1 PLP-dependent aminotransferase family protein [Acetobacter orleanensis]GAN68842.1 transcriptional regulator GntR [Acetobacter orleanensis JCM 7639]GBR23055.1 transcriptional regulator [Acetobacter orleanensis NRIC 0473]GEB83333.1 GntR family transcriptional regulator [Acetobacter orleanensis]